MIAIVLNSGVKKSIKEKVVEGIQSFIDRIAEAYEEKRAYGCKDIDYDGIITSYKFQLLGYTTAMCDCGVITKENLKEMNIDIASWETLQEYDID